MSRCFPYPPPGYAGNCTSNEALILSIKLQREREKAKSEKKKDRRREKKERKRDEKANGILCGEKKIFTDEKLYQPDKHGKYPEVCMQSKQQECSNEHVEKSSLTEEHGRPCCSSDSTENSGKRKRQSLPPSSNNTRSNGTVIRFRLSTQKREDPSTPTSNNPTLCSTSGRVDSSSQKADTCVKSLTTPSLDIPPLSKATLQTIKATKKEALSFPGKGIHEGSTSKDEVKLPKALRKYRALFESWVPPLLEPETTNDDQEWLISSKEEVSQPVKRLKCCKEIVPSCRSPALQPQARFLNDADIYSLPFTVPF